jgi:hypothetical protein
LIASLRPTNAIGCAKTILILILGRRQVGTGAGTMAAELYQASPIKRTRATKAEIEARREDLLAIIAAGRPMTVRGAAAADAGKESVRPPTQS